jgi:hypothetical protein
MNETTTNDMSNGSVGSDVTFTHIPGTVVKPVTGILSFQCPQNTTCQLWSTATGSCGTVASAVIPTMQTQHNESMQQFNTIVGASGDLDNGNSLVKYLKNIIGASADLDAGAPLVEYLKNIIGASADLDAGAPLVEYLKNVVGVSAELDQGFSLTRYLKNIVGVSAELDNVGASGELDNGFSLVKYFKNIFGTNADKDSMSIHAENFSLMKLTNHVHAQHEHYLDSETHQNDTANAMSVYTNYIMENSCLSDLNMDGLIYNTFVTGNDAYNAAVQALIPSPLPEMLKGVKLIEIPVAPAGFVP